LPCFNHAEYQQAAQVGRYIPANSKAYDIQAFNAIVESCMAPYIAAPAREQAEGLVFTREGTDCGICKRPLDVGRGIVLKDCLHTFCRRCLVHAIENKAQAVMMCPSKTVHCQGEVRDDEVKALLTPEAYEDYALGTLIKMGILEEIEDMMVNSEYVENKKVFPCSICTQNIKPGDGITIMNCGHEYCKTCLSRYIENSETAIVACPFRDDDGGKCIGFLLDSEVRSLVTPELYIAFLNKSLDEAKATFANVYPCKTPGCKVWVDIVDLDNYICPGCKRTNCVKCQAIHEGVSCNDYQEMTHGGSRRAREVALTDQQVRQLMDKKEAQLCPRCGILTERIDGCRHMTCTKCKHEFQWQI